MDLFIFGVTSREPWGSFEYWCTSHEYWGPSLEYWGTSLEYWGTSLESWVLVLSIGH